MMTRGPETEAGEEQVCRAGGRGACPGSDVLGGRRCVRAEQRTSRKQGPRRRRGGRRGGRGAGTRRSEQPSRPPGVAPRWGIPFSRANRWPQLQVNSRLNLTARTPSPQSRSPENAALWPRAHSGRRQLQGDPPRAEAPTRGPGRGNPRQGASAGRRCPQAGARVARLPARVPGQEPRPGPEMAPGRGSDRPLGARPRPRAPAPPRACAQDAPPPSGAAGRGGSNALLGARGGWGAEAGELGVAGSETPEEEPGAPVQGAGGGVRLSGQQLAQGGPVLGGEPPAAQLELPQPRGDVVPEAGAEGTPDSTACRGRREQVSGSCSQQSQAAPGPRVLPSPRGRNGP